MRRISDGTGVDVPSLDLRCDQKVVEPPAALSAVPAKPIADGPDASDDLRVSATDILADTTAAGATVSVMRRQLVVAWKRAPVASV